MKLAKIIKKTICCLLALMLMVGWASVMGAQAADGGIVRQYGDFTFTKVSNPTAGSRKADGINTDDITGYPANRLNSYAWAVASRGNSLYIGTNRTLFGSALNALIEMMQAQNPSISIDTVRKGITLLTGGEVPVDLTEEDYVPQIIRFDVGSGKTKVIYRPGFKRGGDGRLYYTDRDGNIIPAADVTSETESFRSVVQFKNNLYFGSLGTNMLQLVRIDESDRADVVFQTTGLISSLRAGCIHDDGNGETIYFGGQDTTYRPWLAYRMTHPGQTYPLPIVIRRLDPATAGTDHEDWSGLVADFNDFGKYAYASVYVSGGGTVWDMCSYNGRLYMILAHDDGWVLFRGEKGGASPNQFGWTWTEIVGGNGKYPQAMNSRIAELNKRFAAEYGGSEYAGNLTGAGLLESTATPYVYNGKMYIGTFDNATMLQSQTVIKALVKIKAMRNMAETGSKGPTLSQIYAPLYEALSHPQHIWVMDENENIRAVTSANALLEGTTNDYVWRFAEYNGKLYAGTFDAATAYVYFLDPVSINRILSVLKQNGAELPEFLTELMEGNFSQRLRSLLPGFMTRNAGISDVKEKIEAGAVELAAGLEKCLRGDAPVEKLLEAATALESALKLLETNSALQNGSRLSDEDWKNRIISLLGGLGLSEEASAMIDWLYQFVDVEGVKYWIEARRLALNTERGFDILVTDDGVNWKKVTGDGLQDPFNYGARTFTILNDELYVGTANPYYGAQLWRVGGRGTKAVDPTKFEDVAVPSNSFTFKKVWEGDSEKSIDFTLYKADGSVYHHGFDKKIVSNREWKYNAWFSAPAACYVIEQPIPGYITRYVNVGVYAQITDRCCDGGTIINKKVPKTGDEAPVLLWAGMFLTGVVGLTLALNIGKRRKAHRESK